MHGADPEILKRGSAQIRKKKILGFRWSKEAKITLETISFRRNISISIFKFSPFLCTIKAYLWNLFNFPKFTNALMRKEKKTLIQQSMRKEKLTKVVLCSITDCFTKPFKRIINLLLFFSHFSCSYAAQFLLFEIRMRQETSKGEIGN